MKDAIYNPHGKPVDELPTIYGFNNGGSSMGLVGMLLAENGIGLGSHICSHEHYMPGDLGVLDGSRPDRHETFREHYPDGYRMEFVGYDAVPTHAKLNAVFKVAEEVYAKSKAEEAVKVEA